MKYSFTILAFLVLSVVSINDMSSQEAEKEVIDQLKVEIKELANGSVCSEEHSCFSVGIGAKPCGGFWEYLIYTGSIDIETFFSKIETLNELEKEYNVKYSIQSDCYIAMPPSSISCEDGKCKGVFQ